MEILILASLINLYMYIHHWWISYCYIWQLMFTEHLRNFDSMFKFHFDLSFKLLVSIPASLLYLLTLFFLIWLMQWDIFPKPYHDPFWVLLRSWFSVMCKTYISWEVTQRCNIFNPLLVWDTQLSCENITLYFFYETSWHFLCRL